MCPAKVDTVPISFSGVTPEERKSAENLAMDALVKEFLKKLTYYQIGQNKRLAEIRLKDLQLLK